MTHGRDKHQSRRNQAEVRRVLTEQWDPIGVKGVPEAADEYDGYVGAVYVMLMDHQTSRENMVGYLQDVATDRMGLPLTPSSIERCRLAADALIALRQRFESTEPL